MSKLPERRGLGRGLSALLGEIGADIGQPGATLAVPTVGAPAQETQISTAQSPAGHPPHRGKNRSLSDDGPPPWPEPHIAVKQRD